MVVVLFSFTMKKFRWQLLIILVTGIIVGVLLLIQQGSTSSQGDASPKPVTGGSYTEALIGSFMRLNPFLDVYNPPDQSVDRLLFSSLIKFNAKGVAEGDLAESWGISQDGTVYNFNLRTDVLWHDGEPLTADDVDFTMRLLKSEDALIPEDLRVFWREIEFTVLSDSAFQFRLPEAFAPFLDYLTFGILPQHRLNGMTLTEMIDDPFNLQPVGSGPYVFERMIVENDVITGVILKANQAYFGGRPYLDQMVFRYYADAASAWNAYAGNEVEGISEVTQEILPNVLAAPNLSLYSVRQPRLWMVYLNLNNQEVSYFENIDFRKALLTGIDRQRIINRQMMGQGLVADGPIMPGTWAYFDDTEHIGFDQTTAKELLIAAGCSYSDADGNWKTKEGQTVEFTLLHPDLDQYVQVAQTIQSDWAAIGIKVNLVAKSYQGVIDDLEARNYQAALVELNFNNTPDPDPYPFWGQSMVQSGQNYSEWVNRSASELIELARASIDAGERYRLYRNFQVVWGRELPALPLFYPVYNYAVNAQIKGISIGPLFDPTDRFLSITSWYLLTNTSDPVQAEQ